MFGDRESILQHYWEVSGAWHGTSGKSLSTYAGLNKLGACLANLNPTCDLYARIWELRMEIIVGRGVKRSAPATVAYLRKGA